MAYDRQVDGLFTYCLSVLCEHDAAADALGEVRELARRHGARLAEPGLLRAWLFSLARYCCLRRLAGGGHGVTGTGSGRAPGAEPGEAEAARRRRELSSLAWPEAAGTDPEQREALELSVRHRLTPLEVAAVLDLPFERTRALLAGAEAEVARTRAALLVLGVGSCPELDRLGGAGTESWRDWVLGPALRRELVQHVVDCPTCRGTAERVAASEAAEGAAGLSGLALLRAPVDLPGAAAVTGAAAAPAATARVVAAPAATARAVAARAVAARVVEPGLRFDQGGFPRHRAPDAGRGLAVRRRVVTTGVLAAVLAAPVIALWAGHRGGGGSGPAASVSTVRVDEAGTPTGQRPRPAVDGPAGPGAPGLPGLPGMELAGAATGMVAGGTGVDGAGVGDAETLLPGFPRLIFEGAVIPVPAHGATPLSSPTLVAAPAPAVDRTSATGTGEPAPAGLLTVEAGEYGSRTVLTLTNSDTTEIRWRAVADAGWLRLSRDSGTLAPGQRITVIVTVDEDQAPATHWTARIALPPSQAVVTLEGGPHNRGGSASSPAEPPPPSTPSSASPSTPVPTGSATTSPTAAPTVSGSPTSPPSPSGPPTGSPSPSGTATAAPPGPDTSPHPTGTATTSPSRR
ncbi:sigma-70 family RNA polymerase sigma factor [Kitasatospora sp. NPDC101235]|uniref:BACON domain-containing protein n=1 Tax=Kitasatospora sp. NPDC101235 TaxID=3364101 RepID=UPI003823B967